MTTGVATMVGPIGPEIFSAFDIGPLAQDSIFANGFDQA
jgi:hypothetical protein